MRISLGPSVVRGNIDETITGLWTFANVLGLLTDIIGERTAAAGVTVDGLLIKDAGIPEAAVTAHETALSILETQIPDGSIFPRLANTEIITGLYVFSHSSGLLTNSISERTAAAGVSVDGALLKDGVFDGGARPVAGNNVILGSVVGDADTRWRVIADGTIIWGDGTNPADVQLNRQAANELGTPDDFNIGGALDLAGALELSKQNTTIAAQADDFDISTFTIQRFILTGAQNISGFDGGAAGKVIVVSNADGVDTLTLLHQSGASLAANRMVLNNATNLAILDGGHATLYYDDSSSRWRPMG